MLTELKLKRLLAGLSGTEVARRAGVERTRYSRLENGHLRPRPEELRRLEEALTKK